MGRVDIARRRLLYGPSSVGGVSQLDQEEGTIKVSNNPLA